MPARPCHTRSMQVYLFASELDPGLYGLTIQETGENLPDGLRPWHGLGTRTVVTSDPGAKESGAIRAAIKALDYHVAKAEHVVVTRQTVEGTARWQSTDSPAPETRSRSRS